MMSDSKKPTSPTPPLPPPPPVKCPRCDSPNTKFCYYNNYSLSQPRHFCKTCRRYWTKGGALRNVPVGGGCRKPKKSSKTGSTSNTATNFQTNQNQFAGFNYPMYAGGGNIALSIESLSSMNQDLHWKLQQQRLAMLFGGATATATATSATSMENVHQVAEPITFHQLQVPVMEVGPEGEICGPIKRVHDQSSTATWFLESSTSSSNVIANTAASVGNDQWNGIIPNWGDMQQFSALP